jgi:hypothetical protein
VTVYLAGRLEAEKVIEHDRSSFVSPTALSDESNVGRKRVLESVTVEGICRGEVKKRSLMCCKFWDALASPC